MNPGAQEQAELRLKAWAGSPGVVRVAIPFAGLLMMLGLASAYIWLRQTGELLAMLVTSVLAVLLIVTFWMFPAVLGTVALRKDRVLIHRALLSDRWFRLEAVRSISHHRRLVALNLPGEPVVLIFLTNGAAARFASLLLSKLETSFGTHATEAGRDDPSLAGP